MRWFLVLLRTCSVKLNQQIMPTVRFIVTRRFNVFRPKLQFAGSMAGTTPSRSLLQHLWTSQKAEMTWVIKNLSPHYLSDPFWASSNVCTIGLNKFPKLGDLVPCSIAALQNACLTSPKTRINDLGPGIRCYDHKHGPEILNSKLETLEKAVRA